MKANRKFRNEDDAVSPVIAVILMVAITVVLAATVYVWVSGFGSQSSQPASALALTKTHSGNVLIYTVSSASSGLRWNDLTFTVAGLSSAYQIVTSDGDVSARSATATLTPSATSVVSAGDAIYIVNGVASAQSSTTLTVLDTQANSVVVTIAGGSLSASSAAGATDLMSASGVSRFSGTAGTFTAGSTRVTLSQAIDMSTLAVGDLSLDNGHSLGASTITVVSPTQFLINWAGDSTAASGDTLTLASGGVNDITNAATTGASSEALTASM